MACVRSLQSAPILLQCLCCNAIYRLTVWSLSKIHGTVFRVASSWHLHEDVLNKSGVSDDFPVQLATRSPDWSAGGLLRCSVARLSVCRCRSPKSTSPTRITCYGRPREDPRSILVRHARFPRDLVSVSDILSRMSRECYEENWCGEIPA